MNAADRDFGDLPAWAEQHLHEAVAATLRKRAALADQRAELARQRAAAIPGDGE